MTDVKHLVNMSINIDVNLTDSLENEESSELICEICVIDKQNRTSSWKSHIRVIKVNKLVHLNLVDDDKISKIDEELDWSRQVEYSSSSIQVRVEYLIWKVSS